MGKPGLEEIRDLARRIATERLAPHAAETDRDRAFPRENVKTLGEAGFQGLIVSEDQAGLGLSRSGFASVVVEIAKACASPPLSMFPVRWWPKPSNLPAATPSGRNGCRR